MTPAQKDETMKYLIPVLCGLLAGAGGGFGSGAIARQTGPMEVVMAETVKAELPSSQIDLLKDASALGQQFKTLNDQMQNFINRYDSDQRESRRTNDAIRDALSEHTAEIGKLQIQVGGAIGDISDLKQGQTQIDKRVQDMEHRTSIGANP